jgi:PAS domain S-box-containing protein
MPPKKQPAVRSETPQKNKQPPVPARVVRKNPASPADESLPLSADKFEFMFDHSIVGKSFTLPSGEMTANQAFCDMLGYSQAEFQNKKWQEITHPDDIALTQSSLDQLLSGQKTSVRFIKRYISKNKAVVWTEVSTSLRRDEAGQPLYFMTELSDITERKQAEEALRESDARYQLVFENSGTSNTIFDTECRVVLQNSLSKEWSQPVDALGKTVLEVFGPEQGPIVSERMRRVMNSGVPEVFETEFILPVGGKWISSSYLPISNEQNRIVGIQVISQDITERKRVEQALRESEEKYRNLVERASDGIVIIQDRIVKYLNPRLAEIWGGTIEEIINTPFDDFIYPDELPAMLDRYKRRVDGEKITPTYETILKRKNGGKAYAELNAGLIMFQGELADLVIVRDITERKQATQQQEILYQVLRTVNGQLDPDFLVQSVLETIGRVTGYPHVCIALPDVNRTHWVVGGVAGTHAEELGATYLIHQGVIGRVFKTGQAQWVRNGLDDPNYVRDVSATGAPALQSEIVAPMRRGDLILGALNIESDRVDAFTDSDVRMIQSVADIISLALENAQSYQEIQQEITERRQAEEALHASEQRYRNIVENSPVGIFQSTPEGRYLQINPHLAHMYGYASSEEALARITDIANQIYVNPAQRQEFTRLLAEQGQISEFINQNYRKDGRIIWTSTDARVVKDQAGKVQYYQGFMTDITERKQTQSLQEAVYQISAAAETTTSLDELYPQIHQIISSVMPAENFYIALYDEAQNILHFPYFKDAQDEPYVGGIQPGQGITAYILRTGKSLLCTQALQDELERQGEVKMQGTPSAIWLGVPLMVAGKTIGAMVVQHYSDPQAYGEREQHMLEFVSTQVAIAINRKQAEQALKESEKRYRGLFENSPISLWEEDFSAVKRHIEKLRRSGVTDFREFFESHPDVLLECVREIKVLDVNAATLALMRAAHKGQLIGNMEQVIPIDAGKDFVNEFVSLAEGQTEFEWEGINYTLDGEKLTVSLHWSAAPGFEDTLEKVLVSMIDITDRRRAQVVLEQAEARYRHLFENAIEGIYQTTPAGHFFTANPALVTMLGYDSLEDLIAGNNDLENTFYVQPGRRKEFRHRLERDGVIAGFESEVYRKDGSAIWISENARVLQDSHGQVIYYEGSLTDITGRKQAQSLQEAVYQIAAAAETTRSLDELYPQIHQIISTVMPAENFYIALYDEAQDLLRFSYFKDAEDEPYVEGIQPRQGLTAYVLRTGKSLLCTQAVHDELERQGEVKLLGVASAIWLGVPLIVEGKTIGAVVVQHYSDPQAYGEREQHMLEFVSTQVAIAIDRKQAEEQIRQLNVSLEQRVEQRTRELREAQEKLVRQEKLATLGQLAGGVGHELRNPLGVINSAVYYLKLVQPDADEKIKKYHLIIEQEVQIAGRIINDLLDFGRIVSPDRQPVSVPELVQHVLTRFPAPASVQVLLKLPASLPKVYADPLHLEQVLGNLTTNACQAMKDGGKLTISASLKKDQVAIAVKDTGTGITPENMQKLFEPLFTTKLRGIGLGLAVSKKLAEASGGRIEVTSQPGKGSTFTLYLPVIGS